MKADKGQFDEVLRRMLKKNPKKTSEIKGKQKHLRRNPVEPNPNYPDVFESSPVVRIVHKDKTDDEKA